MQKLLVFNGISVDGYFTGVGNDLNWAHNPAPDPEWDAFVANNASGGGSLLFGRVTYDMMASFWPTDQAKQQLPTVAAGMNSMKKLVFSRSKDTLPWSNTEVLKGDIVEQVRKLKEQPGKGIAILGSGSIVAQLAPAGVIDEYQMVVTPIALGGGRTMFEGMTTKLPLKLTKTRTFKNGNVLVCYHPISNNH
jgi:dihydrofolate reductase